MVTFYRHLTNSGSCNGIRPHDLCDAGTMLYQMSYGAIQLGVVQLICRAHVFP